MKTRRILVTGGAGFLGSHFIRHALRSGGARVANVDVLSYAGDLRRLQDLEEDPRHRFVRADVTSASDMRGVLAEEDPDLVVHFAAESHVTRSERAPDLFFQTNVEGTRVMLEACTARRIERFVHISTDEVYGPIASGAFRERDKKPGDAQATSPYAKSKALADDLAQSYAARLPVIIARPTNAFGPFQFPEKVFARWVTRGLQGQPLPLWGDGLQVRQWLHAEDCARAIGLVIERGLLGEAYNIGPRHVPEITNLALARWLTSYLGLPEDRVVMIAYDRPNHDRRYAVDTGKLRALGWKPGEVWSQLAATVEWYRANPWWWESHMDAAEAIYADREPSRDYAARA